MAEKTEQPTSKRRKDSAKKGQTFKSKDLVTTLILLSGVYFLAHVMSFRRFTSYYTMILLHGSQIGMNDFMLELVRIFFLLSLPFIAVCVLMGFAATFLQTRFSIATEAIRLNFKALDPVAGAKKMFSMRTLKELVKSLCYLIVFVVTCYSLIHNDLRQVLVLYHADMGGLIINWVSLAVKAVLVFIGWSLFVLLADFIVEYFLHIKDLKMEKHEVKQERKESDGNPQIKSARRRAHQEILSGEDMAAVRNSEVVMANPTHIAIAIYFNPQVASLPFVALRCTNMKARAVIAYAEKIGVPVVRNIALTRRLYHTYRQFSFISLNDDVLIDIMEVLIWLRQVEQAGIVTTEEEQPNIAQALGDGALY
ncbi:TPA: EscU/YscU/HrcU family type III secretion system export apparatus switch protein [Escherichia coli]|uniref:EscU/YscU/HrcU family type III secretion system export apparatus switch protein n=1 Tax=Escherichia coli TaxID=562 RepID=UPI000BE42C4C|nr:EscU/YscU/HrcU family type III secretion system export apparatus switch protein [Escherichia coli]MBS9316434.1 EscU/YscU/HrcU family type III secretion system export apparatus switch protein [Escherichia coli]